MNPLVSINAGKREIETVLRSVGRVHRGATTKSHQKMCSIVSEFIDSVKRKPVGFSVSPKDLRRDKKTVATLLKAKEQLFRPLKNNDYNRDRVFDHIVHQFMPSYSIMYRVFDETSLRLPPPGLDDEFNEDLKIEALDFGAGVGAGAFALSELYGNNVDVHCVEPSGLMNTVGKGFTQQLLGVDSRKCIHWYDSLSQVGNTFERFSVVSLSFVLGELNRNNLKTTVLSLWRTIKSGGILVLVDDSDQTGFERLMEVRSTILEAFPPSDDKGETSSSYVLAPCPHDKPCPIMKSLQNQQKLGEEFRRLQTCYFTQRIQRAILHPRNVLKLLPSTKRFREEVAVPFTYLVMGKGPSPRMEIDKVPIGEEDMDVQVESFRFDRLIQPPLKKGGNVLLDVCSNEHETVIRRIITKGKDGAHAYKEARKAHWGDLYPY